MNKAQNTKKSDIDIKAELDHVISMLSSLEKDEGVPKNVKSKILSIIETLKESTDLSIRVNKSLSELDEIAEDVNVPTFIRTQVWNITSLFEKINR